jgi:poly(3-hydroxybutyrate) depolymerase
MNYKEILVMPIMAGALLASAISAQAGDWRNNGNEQNIGGLDTFVYAPTSQPALADKRALMVSLHGCAQPNSDFKTGAGWPTVADEYGMVVALPQAAGEGSYGWVGCWNFHGGMNTSRTQSDAKYLIDMVNELVNDTTLNIDPNQVYLTGLSSGAGMTNTMGCLAPDIFAGVGVNAGPAPGSTGSTTDLNNPAISVPQGESNCETLAGSNKSHLYTQLHNGVHGSQDGSVSPDHLHRNADIAVAVYDDATSISECRTATVAGAQSGNHGDLTAWCDGNGERVSKILVNGMGHAWPAGNDSSGGGNYIDHAHINYPEWITEWFFTNNRRVSTPPPPPTENSLVLSPPVSMTLENCETFAEPGYTATDKDNGDITDQVDVSGNNFDSCVAGTYTINYSVTFSDTTNDSQNRTVIVEDVPTSTCTEHTANNVTHVSAGRAYVFLGLTYAFGSNESMGLFNIFNTKTLAETSENYYEVGNCP